MAERRSHHGGHGEVGMRLAIAHLVGQTPYSPCRHFSETEVPKQDNGKEGDDAYERRTWRNRLHRTPDGLVQIPEQAFANSIKLAAKRFEAEYAKHFEDGVTVTGNLVLSVKADEIPYDELLVRGTKRITEKRVTKLFPRIDEWEGDVTFHIINDIIPKAIFRQALVIAGLLVGIGRFRPQSWGYYGRFTVEAVEWRKCAEMERSA
jgi:hypothetical protein